MTKRIAEYEIEIARHENLKNNKNAQFPLVIALVVYTDSNKEWKAKTNLMDLQPIMLGYQNLGLGSYDLLDINQLDTNELLDNKNFFYRLLSLEKAKTSEELAKNFYYLSRNETNPSHKAFLKNVLQFVFNEIYSYDKDVYQKILENLESGGDDMFLVDVLIREKNEAIEEGRKEGRKEGILENIRNVATEMLRQNFDDTTIIKTTKIDTETLKKLKESIA